MNFTTTAYGKWILAGEHSVLRGSPALVFPLRSCGMELEFTDSPEPLSVEFSDAHGPELDSLFWAVLERACDLMQVPRGALRGRLSIRSSLPIGSGLGASAAFCVVMTRWFENQNYLRGADLYEFARTLENLFHGESSGVDIAVSLSGQGLHFERRGAQLKLVPRWKPRWYISYTGQRGVTAEAVSKVKQLLLDNPSRGDALDARMRASVANCEEALALDAERGLPLLAQGITQARECFEGWGLAEGLVGEHLRELMDAGALAVKPTGSGGGGYALSLWSAEPPVQMAARLISCEGRT